MITHGTRLIGNDFARRELKSLRHHRNCYTNKNRELLPLYKSATKKKYGTLAQILSDQLTQLSRGKAQILCYISSYHYDLDVYAAEKHRDAAIIDAAEDAAYAMTECKKTYDNLCQKFSKKVR